MRASEAERLGRVHRVNSNFAMQALDDLIGSVFCEHQRSPLRLR